MFGLLANEVLDHSDALFASAQLGYTAPDPAGDANGGPAPTNADGSNMDASHFARTRSEWQPTGEC